MKTRLVLLSLCAALACSCSSNSIETPKGKAEGYQSARLVRATATTVPQGWEDSPEFNQWVQQAIGAEFSKQGLAFGSPDADLIVAYMLLHQATSSTTMNTDYFGHGRDAGAILEKAHERGVIDNQSPDEFEQGAIVIDVLDARTNELVFRNFATRSAIEGVTDAQRQQRVNSAVAETLAPFFR